MTSSVSCRTTARSRLRLRRSRAERGGADRSLPQARMVPAVGRSSPTTIRATVVFPEPDSPTIASDPPSGTANSTSSTATSGPNSLRSPCTARTGSAKDACLQPPPELPGAHASRQAPVQLDQGGLPGPAYVLGVRTSRGERALVRRSLERRQGASGDGGQPVGGRVDVRPGRGQGGGVGMQRSVV